MLALFANDRPRIAVSWFQEDRVKICVSLKKSSFSCAANTTIVKSQDLSKGNDRVVMQQSKVDTGGRNVKESPPSIESQWERSR